MEDLELKALTEIANIIVDLKSKISNELEFTATMGRMFGYLNKKYTDEFKQYLEIEKTKIKLIDELIKAIKAKSIDVEDLEDDSEKLKGDS